MSYHPFGGLTGPLTSRRLYVPDSEINAPAEFAFVPVDGSLFLTAANAAEIRQGNIGDCHLLTALLTIVDHPKGSDFLNCMMVDLRNNRRVLVRLFDENLSPILYELDKTILQHLSPPPNQEPSPRNRHKAPWVYFIEKAYAAHRIKFGGECYQPQEWDKKTDHNGKEHYFLKNVGALRKPANQLEALTGGKSSDCFQILLGRRAESIIIPKDTFSDGNPLDILRKVMKDQGSAVCAYERLSQSEKTAFQAVFSCAGFTVPDQEPEAAIARAIQDFRDHITTASILAAEEQFDEKSVPRLEELIGYIDTYFRGISGDTKGALLRFFNENVASKRGLGRYLPRYDGIYATIYQALAHNHLVSLASDEEIGRIDQNPMTQMESQIKGLAGPHCYQILNCYERNGLKILLLRNPWHRYTREYVQRPWRYQPLELPSHISGRPQESSTTHAKHTVLHAQAVNDAPFRPIYSHVPYHSVAIPTSHRELEKLRLGNHGVFELVLEDLIKRFSHIYICNPDPWYTQFNWWL